MSILNPDPDQKELNELHLLIVHAHTMREYTIQNIIRKNQSFIKQLFILINIAKQDGCHSVTIKRDEMKLLPMDSLCSGNIRNPKTLAAFLKFYDYKVVFQCNLESFTISWIEE